MTLFDGVKNFIIEALRPGAQQERGELETLRQLYDNSNSGNLRPNNWYQIVNASSGALLGYSYVCNCMREFQLPHPNEWARDYSCLQCKANFNLYKQKGIADAEGKFLVSVQDIERILGALPVRPRLDGAQRGGFVDTWAEGGDGSVDYEPYSPSSLIGR